MEAQDRSVKTTDEASHSPLPWRLSYLEHTIYGSLCHLVGPDGELLAVDLSPQDAEFIIRAVNNNADLLAALKAIVAADDRKSLDCIVRAIPAARAAIQKAEASHA